MAELMDGEIRCKPTLQVPRIVIQTAIKDGAKFYSSDPLRWLGEKTRLRCEKKQFAEWRSRFIWYRTGHDWQRRERA